MSDVSKVGFYKSFGRPIAKVFLGAIVTYQITYLFWTKLETDEIKQQKQSMFAPGHGFLRTETDTFSFYRPVSYLGGSTQATFFIA